MKARALRGVVLLVLIGGAAALIVSQLGPIARHPIVAWRLARMESPDRLPGERGRDQCSRVMTTFPFLRPVSTYLCASTISSKR